jgi:5-formyltetrahydrofolate cyclo-ligase
MTPPPLPAEDKTDLRRRYGALRNGLTGEERAAAEAAIRNTLFSLPAWRDAPLVCGYVSIRGELNTLPLWERAAAEGKSYALPVTVTGAAEGRMIFRRIEGFAPHRLIPARFGVPEPPEDCPALTLSDFAGAVILIPGLAFDDGGYRIGYGGGYYDRFLASLAAARIPVTTVGLVFSVCRPPLLPRRSHDIPVDYVIDERRMTVVHGIPVE